MNTLKKNGGEGEGTSIIPNSDPAPAWENPLIPNKKLRELYTAMVELRLLERRMAKLQRSAKPSARLRLHPGHSGLEGCLAATVLSLNPGDITSQPSAGIATRFLRGAKLSALLAPEAASQPADELPPLADTTVRLHLTIGAALALAAKKGSLAVAYVYAGELALPQWKPTLKLAAAHAAPLLFVILPAPNAARPGKLSLVSTACGVPGIPVDAADPVALYRVAQEAMLRARAGGGPVLMECIPFHLPGKRPQSADPILTMQQFLLPRGVATEAWFQNVAARFAARLKAAAK